jgi:hypothetical protein
MSHFDTSSPKTGHAQCVVCEKFITSDQWFARIKREGQTLMLCSQPCADRFYARRLPLLRHINLLAMLQSSNKTARPSPVPERIVIRPVS